jgi:hypothetical protein
MNAIEGFVYMSVDVNRNNLTLDIANHHGTQDKGKIGENERVDMARYGQGVYPRNSHHPRTPSAHRISESPREGLSGLVRGNTPRIKKLQCGFRPDPNSSESESDLSLVRFERRYFPISFWRSEKYTCHPDFSEFKYDHETLNNRKLFAGASIMSVSNCRMSIAVYRLTVTLTRTALSSLHAWNSNVSRSSCNTGRSESRT